MSFQAILRGLPELLAKFEKAKEIIEAETRTAITEGAVTVQGDVREFGPVDIGRLRSSVGYEVRGTFPEIRGIVGTNVEARGFPYPAALDASERYHYRRGPRKGSPTFKYFSGSLERKQKQILDFFQAAARRIAARLN